MNLSDRATRTQGGPSPTQLRIQIVLAIGYVGVVVLGFSAAPQPRIFWTMLLPLLPIGIVLMGFSQWRRICPLAFWGQLGTRIKKKKQRRVPKWMEQHFFVLTFFILLIMLSFRLLAINGDGVWLALCLVGLGVAAALTNGVFTGKTWCNFVCPVGLVERIYTEPNSLLLSGSSQCVKCTACKKNCPDIDQENAYWKDVEERGRRLAYYAFPGLVFGFYFYYWLRAGTWEAYFDGSWTDATVELSLVMGPGFFFAEGVPALIAAPLSLLIASAVSLGVFLLIERGVGVFITDPELSRHRTLVLAAFTAFNFFYLFAGAPTLRQIGGGTNTVAFVVPIVSALFLTKRWNRTHESYVQERGATKLLKKWPADLPAPRDASEVFAFFKASDRAQGRQLAAYRELVADVLADGIVTTDELRLLEVVRSQLGISDKEHARGMEQLSEAEQKLFASDQVMTIEQRVQLEGFEVALETALTVPHSTGTLEDLANEHGVSEAQYQHALERLRGESGAISERAADLATRLARTHAGLAVASSAHAESSDLLVFMLRARQRELMLSAAEFLELVGRELPTQSQEPDPSGLIAEMDRVGAGRMRDVTEQEASEVLAELLEGFDPYLRAAALPVVAELKGVDLVARIERGLADDHPLVRETAVRVSHQLGILNYELRSLIDNQDPEGGALVRQIEAAGTQDLGTLDRMDYLRAVPLFTELDSDDLYALSRLATEEEVVSPACICVEGEPGDDLFVVVSGEAEVVVRTEEGERRLGVHSSPDVIGELSVLDGSPRSATVRPLGGSVRILRIRGTEFRDRLLGRPDVGTALIATLTRRLRSATELVG